MINAATKRLSSITPSLRMYPVTKRFLSGFESRKRTIYDMAKGLSPKERVVYSAYMVALSGFMLFVSDKLEEMYPAPPEEVPPSMLSTSTDEQIRIQTALLETDST